MSNNNNHNKQRVSATPGASLQVSRNPGHRSSLMPTDGQGAYKRSTPSRASRKSRAERTSYLVATGHLDPEETEQLNRQSDSSTNTGPQYCEQSPSISSPPRTSLYSRTSISEQYNISDQTSSPTVTPNKRSIFEQSFLENLNRTLANSPTIANNMQLQNSYELKQENAFKGPPRKRGSKKQKNKQKHLSLSNPRGDHDNETQSENARGKFRQTYTEVTLPMKTSPAFEYILKDHERRNKRCCLWLIYSILLTMCFAIIIFCSAHLILRSH